MDVATMFGLFIMGWLSGYLVRILKKILLVVLAGQSVFLLWLERQGVITINYGAIYEKFGNLINDIINIAPEVAIKYATYGLPYACGFLIGCIIPKSVTHIPRGGKYIRRGKI